VATSETPPALNWMKLLDSKGISVWAYEMSLNTGGITSPGKFVWSFLVTLTWQGYRALVVFAIWLINWVLSFSWLDWVATPVIALSKSVATLVHTFGLAPTFLTIMAATCAAHIFRGRWTMGAFDLVVGCAIAALAVGGLSNPVGLVTGQSGYIMQARDLGLELSSGLAHNGDTTSNADQMREQTSAMLVDTFIRMPAEMINFGRSLNGDPCEAKYDEVMRSGPHGGDDTVRIAMQDCNAAMGDYADKPNSGMAISAIILSPSAIFVMLFALLLCVAVMLAVATVLYESLKLLVVMVWAILPGDSRGSLWQTFANVVMALATMTFAVVFLTAYLLLLQSVFSSTNSGGNGVMATFIFVDLLIVMGIILFWKGRKALKRSAARLAAVLAKRPAGGSPSRLPAPQHSGLPGQAAALQAGRMLSQRSQGKSPAGDPSPAGKRGWVPEGTSGVSRSVPRAASGNGFTAAAAAGGARRRGGDAGAAVAAAASSAGVATTATSLGKQLAASQGKKAVKGTLVRMAAHAAAGVATGGASTAVTAASAARTAQVANNARRAVVAARSASAAIGGPPHGKLSPKGAPEALPPSPRGGGRVLPPAPPTPSRGGFDEVDAAGQTVLLPSRRRATSDGEPQPPTTPPGPPAASPSGDGSRPHGAGTPAHPRAQLTAGSGKESAGASIPSTSPRAPVQASNTTSSRPPDNAAVQLLRARLAARRQAQAPIPTARLPR